MSVSCRMSREEFSMGQERLGNRYIVPCNCDWHSCPGWAYTLLDEPTHNGVCEAGGIERFRYFVTTHGTYWSDLCNPVT